MIERPARSYDFRVIALDLIDPPPTPMRESMDDAKLEELTQSIRADGVLMPLGVFEVAGRFRIIYGHRRSVAARAAGESAVPCRVHADGDAREEDFKLIENSLREDVNPAEEATWLADLLERKCGESIEKLCGLVGRKESWINGRLDLLRGGADVLQALRDQKINLAVARELNKIKDAGYRGLALEDAVRDGATAADIQRRRMEFERTLRVQELSTRPDIASVEPSTAAPFHSVENCLLCALAEDHLQMVRVNVHKDCLTQHIRMQRAAVQGGQ